MNDMFGNKETGAALQAAIMPGPQPSPPRWELRSFARQTGLRNLTPLGLWEPEAHNQTLIEPAQQLDRSLQHLTS